MDAECCSSRCLREGKCAAPLVLWANRSAEAILSHGANRSAELLQANGSLARSLSCRLLQCGRCPYKRLWCNEDSENMDDAWCHGSVGNCATCHGLWCAAAMLEASANQTAERLAGVASKSVEANLHEVHECKKSREKLLSDLDMFPARGAAGKLL